MINIFSNTTFGYRFLLKYCTILILAFVLNSCFVVQALLGINECNYPDCTRECVDNCDYCMIHCDRYNVPTGLNKKVDEAVKKQMELDRYNRNKELR